MAISPICSIPDCGKPSDRLGYCTAHYMRQRRNNGDPLAGRVSPGTLENFVRAAAAAVTDECIIWPFHPNKKTGYGLAKVDGKTLSAHRAVLYAATGQLPSRELHAAHSCHNRRCVNPRHLRWATPKENEADKIMDGTIIRGERHPLSKLTGEAVRTIRDLEGTVSSSELGKRFGVARDHVRLVQRRMIWAWLD